MKYVARKRCTSADIRHTVLGVMTKDKYNAEWDNRNSWAHYRAAKGEGLGIGSAGADGDADDVAEDISSSVDEEASLCTKFCTF